MNLDVLRSAQNAYHLYHAIDAKPQDKTIHYGMVGYDMIQSDTM